MQDLAADRQRINVITIPSGWSAIARNLARSKGRTAQGWKCVMLGSPQ